MKTGFFKLGRNSVVTVIGGSGFLGSYTVRELARTGATIKVVSRDTNKAAKLRTCGAVGQIGLVNADATNAAQIEKAIHDSDAVVNLVGILYCKGKQNFSKMHVEVASAIARACHDHKVKRLVHVSALGVERSSQSSAYAKSKLAGEKAVIHNCPYATILRPSVMFGAEDNFINLFSRMAKVSPVLPLIGNGTTRFQPVFVADVARAIVKCLQVTPALACGKIMELGGPTVYTFKEIMRLILKTGRRHRPLIPVPFAIAKAGAFFLEALPKPPLTCDQVELLKYDNIVFGKNGLETLEITPIPLENIIITYAKPHY